EARQEWELICGIARRMGYPMHYRDVAAVFDELVAATPLYANLSHANLGAYGRWYPCPHPNSEGEKILFRENFPIGRARFVPAESGLIPARPDQDYPYILNTGRQLEHWHTGVMTRRSRALDEIAPEAFVEVHPADGDDGNQQRQPDALQDIVGPVAQTLDPNLPGHQRPHQRLGPLRHRVGMLQDIIPCRSPLIARLQGGSRSGAVKGRPFLQRIQRLMDRVPVARQQQPGRD